MFHHLSAPPRAARLKGCTAEPWKAASPNWEPNTPDTLTSVNNLALALGEAGQVGGGRDEVFGVQRGGLPGTVGRKAFLMWPGRDG